MKLSLKEARKRATPVALRVKEKLLELVEALREAGQQRHHTIYDEGDDCPALGDETKSCYCGLRKHNAAVNAVAKALVAEIEKAAAKDHERKKWIKAAVRTVEDCPEEGCEHCAHIMPLYNQNSDTILKEPR